jgi:hypothetical protein
LRGIRSSRSGNSWSYHELIYYGHIAFDFILELGIMKLSILENSFIMTIGILVRNSSLDILLVALHNNINI